MARNFTDKSLWNPGFQVNNVNAPIIGQFNAMFYAAQQGQIDYGSQDDLGKRFLMTEAEAASYTYTPNGTLYGGIYQLVQVDSGATAANVAVGKVAYSLTSEDATYGVTDEANADATTEPIGVFLNTITPGYYGIICVHGKVNVAFKSSLSNGSPAVGDAVFSGGGSGNVDDLATNVTWSTALLSRYLGVALAAPTGGATSAIRFRPLFGRY